ncbi:MAG: ABC-type cobalamin/Fe3+-siderophore transport system, ATPase component [Bacteroidetes bacterium]|jgi:iron complex transport system ATP-binding protein|nr:ABC-type cobalamin/Fe3+-siderophore transport system, ATPase component [Bacteroidota bacterium]
MIAVKQLEIGYRKGKHPVSVFSNMNMSLDAGDLVGLMGDNGIGKSTFIKTLTGNLTPLSGEITLNGKSITQYSAQELATQLSVVVTEKIGGFNLSVWDVVAAGRTPYINIFGKLSEDDEAIVIKALKQLNLLPLKDKLIDELSDGQRQKVMIAKSLAQQTSVIVLDEPTAFLDHSSRHHLFSVLKQLCTEQGKLIIVSSHDLELMKTYINRSVTMAEGNRLEVL